jgi:hypothetical protein
LADAPGERETLESESESWGALFGRLLADGRALIAAEVALYRSIAVRQLAGSRRIALLGVAGLFLLAASVTALLVGLMIALAREIGPLCAALAIGLGGIAVGIVLLWCAARQFRRITGEAQAKASEEATP